MNGLADLVRSICPFAGLGLAIFAAAVALSMLGQGGGTLYTPVQLLFGVGFHEAATTSLFLIMVTSVSAVLVFRRAHRIDWPLAAVLESVTATGGMIGGLASELLPLRLLIRVLVGTMIFAALFMVYEFEPAEDPVVRQRWYRWQRHFGGRDYAVNLILALPASFLAGLVSGLTGIGGGLLKVPLMVLLLGVPMEIAVGSSALMVGITAAGGFAGHVIAGHWNWRASSVLALAAFAGGQIGARIGLKLRTGVLKKLFGFLLLAMALVLGLRA